MPRFCLVLLQHSFLSQRGKCSLSEDSFLKNVELITLKKRCANAPTPFFLLHTLCKKGRRVFYVWMQSLWGRSWRYWARRTWLPRTQKRFVQWFDVRSHRCSLHFAYHCRQYVCIRRGNSG